MTDLSKGIGQISRSVYDGLLGNDSFVDARLETCKVCPNLVKESELNLDVSVREVSEKEKWQCGLCGCPLRLSKTYGKVNGETNSCPLSKW